MQQWLMERTETTNQYTKPMPFGRLCGTGPTLVVAKGQAQFDLTYDGDTKRINTRDEYNTAFITEDGHFEYTVAGASTLIMFWLFTFNPNIKLPSNKDTKDEIILANNSMEKYFPNSTFKLYPPRPENQHENDPNKTDTESQPHRSQFFVKKRNMGRQNYRSNRNYRGTNQRGRGYQNRGFRRNRGSRDQHYPSYHDRYGHTHYTQHPNTTRQT